MTDGYDRGRCESVSDDVAVAGVDASRQWKGLPGRVSSMLAAVAAGVALLGVASRLALPIPGSEVPISLQSFALGVWAGCTTLSVALTTVAAYLLAGALGAPLFADGASGWEHLSGPTAGYLWGFLPAAWLAASGTERATRRASPGEESAGTARQIARWSVRMLAAHAILLALGGAWLATSIGAPRAFDAGVLPFVPGALVKSVTAATLVVALLRLMRR